MNVIVINRRFCGWSWSDGKTAYHKVIDHAVHQVGYVVDASSIRGLHEIERTQGFVIEVASLDDQAEVTAAVERAMRRLGGAVDRLIALTEDDIDLAARLRALHDIPGDKPADVERFRNKMVMKAQVVAAGVRVPAYVPASRATEIAERFGYPVVLKPVDGAGSEGVVMARDDADLRQHLQRLNLESYEAEQFISGEIYHLDGFMFRGSMVFCQVFQYFNSAFAFVNGLPVGVMMVDSPQVRTRLTAFAGRALAALRLDDGPFHLELFGGQDGDTCFLEVAARVGGAFVAPCVERRWGVSLFEETLAWQVDGGYRPTRLNEAVETGPLVGWVAFPVPRAGSTRVKRVRPPPELPQVVEAKLPSVGQRLDLLGGFTHAAGTFFLAAPTQRGLLDAVKTIVGGYSVEFETV